MRERQSLDEALGSLKRLESDLDDNIELIELGELEADEEVVTDAEEAIKKLEEAFLALQEDRTYGQMMKRLGENADLLSGAEYQSMREGQSEAYKALVDSITWKLLRSGAEPARAVAAPIAV